ncbi:hypothetical protein BJ993_005040 [Nocardioides aromaticivorans]|uniref:MinD-like ATPase involved in chromosome partitioning or flagellar assembly n=1 Tax=Nocardioides aromaticivorans TaxID=200618 RepID=A0A7Z0CNY0_9ACTN|nr:hypothetical protein [Nocardioides aromaticivorans]NYI47894.1 hypothetical protein [Nocardioides aromaticivorans]
MSTSTVPRYSTRELQAAAAALAAGTFSTTSTRTATADAAEDQDSQAIAAPPAAAEDRGRAPRGTDRTPDEAVAATGALVRVRAANAGAGASTIALALADAADAAGIRTRVLDTAAPAWSGLLGATVTELGAAEGWRRGRRGDGVLIDRVEDPVRVLGEVPRPRSVDGVDLTVLDAGWSMRELAASGAGSWVATTPARAEVLVTRPHGLALSQTEAALADVEDQLGRDGVVVVVVGAARWSDREFAAAGRLLRTARQQEAVLFMPLLPAKALPGLGPDPLPKQLTSPSQRLLERITTITGPLTANRT